MQASHLQTQFRATKNGLEDKAWCEEWIRGGSVAQRYCTCFVCVRLSSVPSRKRGREEGEGLAEPVDVYSVSIWGVRTLTRDQRRGASCPHTLWLLLPRLSRFPPKPQAVTGGAFWRCPDLGCGMLGLTVWHCPKAGTLGEIRCPSLLCCLPPSLG